MHDLSTRNSCTFELCWSFATEDTEASEALCHSVLKAVGLHKYNKAWDADGATEAFWADPDRILEVIRGHVKSEELQTLTWADGYTRTPTVNDALFGEAGAKGGTGVFNDDAQPQ